MPAEGVLLTWWKLKALFLLKTPRSARLVARVKFDRAPPLKVSTTSRLWDTATCSNGCLRLAVCLMHVLSDIRLTIVVRERGL